MRSTLKVIISTVMLLVEPSMNPPSCMYVSMLFAWSSVRMPSK